MNIRIGLSLTVALTLLLLAPVFFGDSFASASLVDLNITFKDITSPSATHKAYGYSGVGTYVAYGAEGTEFTTAAYGNIASAEGTYQETATAATSDYAAFQRYAFNMSKIATANGFDIGAITGIYVKYEGYGTIPSYGEYGVFQAAYNENSGTWTEANATGVKGKWDHNSSSIQGLSLNVSEANVSSYIDPLSKTFTVTYRSKHRTESYHKYIRTDRVYMIVMYNTSYTQPAPPDNIVTVGIQGHKAYEFASATSTDYGAAGTEFTAAKYANVAVRDYDGHRFTTSSSNYAFQRYEFNMSKIASENGFDVRAITGVDIRWDGYARQPNYATFSASQFVYNQSAGTWTSANGTGITGTWSHTSGNVDDLRVSIAEAAVSDYIDPITNFLRITFRGANSGTSGDKWIETDRIYMVVTYDTSYVPPVTELEEVLIPFTDITSPSSTHKAYYFNGVTATDYGFVGTEFPTNGYSNISVADGWAYLTSYTNTNYAAFHRFEFNMSKIASENGFDLRAITNVKIEYVGHGFGGGVSGITQYVYKPTVGTWTSSNQEGVAGTWGHTSASLEGLDVELSGASVFNHIDTVSKFLRVTYRSAGHTSSNQKWIKSDRIYMAVTYNTSYTPPPEDDLEDLIITFADITSPSATHKVHGYSGVGTYVAYGAEGTEFTTSAYGNIASAEGTYQETVTAATTDYAAFQRYAFNMSKIAADNGFNVGAITGIYVKYEGYGTIPSYGEYGVFQAAYNENSGTWTEANATGVKGKWDHNSSSIQGLSLNVSEANVSSYIDPLSKTFTVTYRSKHRTESYHKYIRTDRVYMIVMYNTSYTQPAPPDNIVTVGIQGHKAYEFASATSTDYGAAGTEFTAAKYANVAVRDYDGHRFTTSSSNYAFQRYEFNMSKIASENGFDVRAITGVDIRWDGYARQPNYATFSASQFVYNQSAGTWTSANGTGITGTWSHTSGNVDDLRVSIAEAAVSDYIDPITKFLRITFRGANSGTSGDKWIETDRIYMVVTYDTSYVPPVTELEEVLIPFTDITSPSATHKAYGYSGVGTYVAYGAEGTEFTTSAYGNIASAEGTYQETVTAATTDYAAFQRYAFNMSKIAADNGFNVGAITGIYVKYEGYGTIPSYGEYGVFQAAYNENSGTWTEANATGVKGKWDHNSSSIQGLSLNVSEANVSSYIDPLSKTFTVTYRSKHRTESYHKYIRTDRVYMIVTYNNSYTQPAPPDNIVTVGIQGHKAYEFASATSTDYGAAGTEFTAAKYANVAVRDYDGHRFTTSSSNYAFQRYEFNMSKIASENGFDVRAITGVDIRWDGYARQPNYATFSASQFVYNQSAGTWTSANGTGITGTWSHTSGNVDDLRVSIAEAAVSDYIDPITNFLRIPFRGANSGTSGDKWIETDRIYMVVYYHPLPTTPVLIFPGAAAANVTIIPTFDWNASESETQPLTYEFQLGTSPTYATLLLNVTALSSTEYAYTAGLNSSTVYYWRVRAKDAEGYYSFWSERSFTTEVVPIPRPTITRIQDNTQNNSYILLDTNNKVSVYGYNTSYVGYLYDQRFEWNISSEGTTYSTGWFDSYQDINQSINIISNGFDIEKDFTFQLSVTSKNSTNSSVFTEFIRSRTVLSSTELNGSTLNNTTINTRAPRFRAYGNTNYGEVSSVMMYIGTTYGGSDMWNSSWTSVTAFNATWSDYLDYNGTTIEDGIFYYTVYLKNEYGRVSSPIVKKFTAEVNDPPIAQNDSAEINEDAAVNISVLDNDSDEEDGAVILLTEISSPAHGTAQKSGNKIYYYPDRDYYGADSFTYNVSDSEGVKDTATVNITINAVNDAPVPTDSEAQASEGGSVSSSVGATDVDSGTLTYTKTTDPTYGVLSFTNGSYTYTPNADFWGVDRFSWTVSDGSGGSAVGYTTLKVVNVNDAPVGLSQNVTMNEDTTLNGVVNYSDVDDIDEWRSEGHETAIIIKVNGKNWTSAAVSDLPLLIVFNSSVDDFWANWDNDDGDDARIYDASGNILPYEVIDFNSSSKKYILYVKASASTTERELHMYVNAIANESNENASAVWGVNAKYIGHFYTDANDSSANAYHAAVSGATLVADSNFYDGRGYYFDGLNDKITLPSHWAPTSYTIVAQYWFDRSTTNTYPRIYNHGDRWAQHYISHYSLSYGALNKQYLSVKNSDLTYKGTPGQLTGGVDGTAYDFGVAMTDYATYTRTYLNGVKSQSNQTLSVIGTTAQPIIGSAGSSQWFKGRMGSLWVFNEVKSDDWVSLVYRQSRTQNALIKTTVAKKTTFSKVADASNGSVELNTSTGTFNYTPDTNYYGTDSFTFKVNDGFAQSETKAIIFNIQNINDAPVPQPASITVTEDTLFTGKLNATDVDNVSLTYAIANQAVHGTATVTNAATGAFTYMPTGNYSGADAFNFSVYDGQYTVKATITVNVTAVNDAPVPQSANITATEDSLFTGKLNATDVDNPTLTYAIANQASHGTATVTNAATGAFTYMPTVNYFGPDAFNFSVYDGQYTVKATITVNVTAVNDAPVAKDDAYNVSEDIMGNIFTVLLNDSDVDGDTLSITSITVVPSHGTATIKGTYIEFNCTEQDYYGPDQFTYQISDGKGGSDTAVVYINILSVKDPPTAVPDTFNVGRASVANWLDVKLNDYDVEGGTIFVSGVTTPTHGTASVSANQVLYTPPANYSGVDTFRYFITSGGAEANATVTVNIANTAPVPANDAFTVYKSTTGNVLNVTRNDTDADGDALSITAVSTPTRGTAIISGINIIYAPPNNFTGSDTFTYTVSDGFGGWGTATVTVSITERPAAPSSGGAGGTTPTPPEIDVLGDLPQLPIPTIESIPPVAKENAAILAVVAITIVGIIIVAIRSRKPKSKTPRASLEINMGKKTKERPRASLEVKRMNAREKKKPIYERKTHEKPKNVRKRKAKTYKP